MVSRVFSFITLAAVASQAFGQVSGDVVPGEILVSYDNQAPLSKTVIGAFIGKRGRSVVADLERVKVNPSAGISDLSDFIRGMPGVSSAEPNRYWRLADFAKDPMEPEQWAPEKLRARYAWNKATGSGVVVALIDTGVDHTHPDLAGRVLRGRNFTTDNSSDTMDRHGHGTHCAGIISASAGNGVGVVGTAPAAYILPVKVIGDNGLGKTDHIVAGIRWAVDNGAKVLSLSFGSNESSSAINKELERAWTRGVVVVAAAGNNNNSTKFYPAAYERAIAVAASTRDDLKASFSNYGSWVDVSAPGVQVLSTKPGGLYRTMSGTSMAAPHVAGLAAILFSQLGLSASPTTIRSRIEGTTVPMGTSGVAAYGRIDLLSAVGGRLITTPETETEHQCLDIQATVGSVRGAWLPNLVESDNRRVYVRSAFNNGSYRTDALASFSVRAPELGGSIEINFEVSSTRAANTDLWIWNIQRSDWDLLGTVETLRRDETSTFILNSYGAYLNNDNVLLKLSSNGEARYDLLLDKLLIESVDP